MSFDSHNLHEPLETYLKSVVDVGWMVGYRFRRLVGFIQSLVYLIPLIYPTRTFADRKKQ